MARDLVLEVIEQVRGNALGQAKRDLEGVADSTDRASRSARDYSAELKQTEERIEATRLRVQELGAEFVRTSDKGTAKDLRGERSLLRQLERIRKELEDAAGGPVGIAVGTSAGQGFSDGFLGAIGSMAMRRPLIAALVALGLIAAPPLGAIIAGAVTGISGLGGIAGGIAAASRDAGVRRAAHEFGKDIQFEFFGSGSAFVQPTIDSLGILSDAFRDLDLGDSFQRVAPWVTTVAAGIGGLGREFMPGFNKALDEAGPLLGVLGKELPELGDALGDMLADMGESRGAIAGWVALWDLLEGTLRTAGVVVHDLSDAWANLVDVGVAVTDFLIDQNFEDLWGWIPWVGTQISDSNRRFHEWQDTMRNGAPVVAHFTQLERDQGLTFIEVTDQLRAMNDAYRDFLGIQMSQDEANRRVQEGMLRLKETLRDNGRHWETNTKAGLENRAMLSAQVDALIRQRDANIAAGMDADKATMKFQAELDKLRAIAKAAGASEEALNDLVGDYYVRIFFQEITTWVAQGFKVAGDMVRKALGFQHGGAPPVGEPFWVGEGGPELMQLLPRPRVWSPSESRQIASHGGLGGVDVDQLASAIAEKMVEALHQAPLAAPVINVNPSQRMSEEETAAIVARELAWVN